MPVNQKPVMLQHNKVYTSTEGVILPSIPEQRSSEVIQNMRPLEVVDRHWYMDSFPDLPMALLHPQFTGIFVQRLIIDSANLPIIQHGGYWQLHPALIEAWARLENALYFVFKKLIAKTEVNLPLDMYLTKMPHTYRYRGKFISPKQARNCILRSHEAFLPLMTMVSFAIAVYPDHCPDPYS
ncbi:hypothetical protein M422DRAFT_54767 [Sphaerobolus stellatus SS14]|uniref:Uncharacterized protein n=1 Tax=Sphaerobolus stellatus (strain SS14) TaxID=990650 RepID=A0A0C9USB0_SPHS4|nr:hypothetical protein M422DRAFT_54767 [Sphaerobolus stellatus SS14]